MTEAQVPGKLSPLPSELLFPLSLQTDSCSELTTGNEMRASPELIFSPISNPDNGENPNEILGLFTHSGMSEALHCLRNNDKAPCVRPYSSHLFEF